MKENEYMAIRNAIKGAETDDTPFAMQRGKELAVFGDPNKTKAKKYNLSITFETEDGIHVKEYKDLFVPPYERMRLVRMFAELLPYFKKPMEDGSIGEYSVYEMAEIMANFDQDIYDKMYELVMFVCKIPAELKPYIDPASVIVATTQLIADEGGAMNESDLSFEKSSDYLSREATP